MNLFEQFAEQYVKNINTEQRIYKPRTEVVGKTFAVNKRHNKKVVQIKFALSNRIADLSKCECDYSVNNVPYIRWNQQAFCPSPYIFENMFLVFFLVKNSPEMKTKQGEDCIEYFGNQSYISDTPPL